MCDVRPSVGAHVRPVGGHTGVGGGDRVTLDASAGNLVFPV